MIKGYTSDKYANIKEVDYTKAKWIHLLSPSYEEIRILSNQYNFPEDYLTNVLDNDEIAREENLNCNDTKNSKLISLLYPVKQTNAQGVDLYTTRVFSIILTDSVIISASEINPNFFNQLLTNNNDYLVDLENHQSFVLEVAWLTSHDYICCLKKIHESIDLLEKDVAKSMETHHLFKLLNFKKSLVYIGSGTESNHPILEKIKSLEFFIQNKGNRKLLHNMTNENKQSEMMIKQYNKLLEQIGDLFSSIISNRLNNLMKVLTSMSIILTIPSIIGALWGMNVSLPFEKNPIAFRLLICGSLMISLGVAFLLRKKKYM